MARGIRQHTREMVDIAHRQKPLSIGPMIGHLSMKVNISAGMLADLLKVHDQTMLRWFMGYSEPPIGMYRRMASILAFLLWVNETGAPPFIGDGTARKVAFAKRMRDFLASE